MGSFEAVRGQRMLKAMFKFGANHLYHGKNPTQAFPIGNLAHEMALANDAPAFGSPWCVTARAANRVATWSRRRSRWTARLGEKPGPLLALSEAAYRTGVARRESKVLDDVQKLQR